MKRIQWLAPLLCAPLFLAGLGGTGLADPDEGRNAEVGREMLASGDYVTPRLNGAVYLDKPPVFFWMVAGSLAAFGTNEAAARLPSALAAVAGVALTVWFARRRFGAPVAACAAAILALSPLYQVFARLVIFDMLLLVWTTTCTFLFYEAMEGERPSRWLGVAGFVVAGLGTITKGPVALVVPLLVAVAWALVERRPSLLRRLRPGAGMLAYAVVVLPWLLVVERRHPGFLAYAVLGENLARMTANPYDTARPFHFYLQVILPGLFPWILLLAAQGIGLAWSRLPGRQTAPAAAPHAGSPGAAAQDAAPPGEARAARFVALWLAVIVVFFSLVASKRPSYILPASIPVAILAARLIVRGSRAATRDAALRAAGTVTAAVATIVLAATAWVAASGGGPVALGRVGRAARDSGVPPILLWAAAAALLVGAALLLAVRRSARPAIYVAVAALPLVALLPVARFAVRHIDSLRSSRAVSRFLQERLADRDRVVCFEEFRPGLNFYLERPIGQVTRAGRIFTSNYIAAHLDAQRADPGFRLMEPAALQAALRDPAALTYVLAPRKEFDALRRTAGLPLQAIWEGKGFGLFLPAAEVTGDNHPLPRAGG
ncbi:MAG TPA: glycosyltransferase family 39 protein [Candidatus Polarisedimenticolia bacterium]|nr:glycosyltransferase family 39 protein [Candidatus Polarisedimenticolia bacterium]